MNQKTITNEDQQLYSLNFNVSSIENVTNIEIIVSKVLTICNEENDDNIMEERIKSVIEEYAEKMDGNI